MKSRVFFFITLSLIFTSCSYLPKWKKDDQPQIRIVDLQGKSHPVVTKVPELNAQALASQGSTMTNPISMPTKKPAQVGEIRYQNYQDQNLANAQATSSFPQAQQTTPTEQATETENDEMLQAGVKEKDQEVEYDLNESKPITKSNKKSSHKKSSNTNSGTEFFVQVGSFSTHDRAESMLKRMKKFHSGKVETVEGEKTIYRALLGPLSNKTKARALAKKITSTGQDAIVTKGN